MDGDYAKAVLIEKQNPLVTAAIVPFHKVHLYVILNFQWRGSITAVIDDIWLYILTFALGESH